MDIEEKRRRSREACRKWAAKNDRSEYYREYEKARVRDPRTVMYNNSCGNARRKGLEHTICKEDIIIPNTCPCCYATLSQPSLDRVDNSKGYTKNNIQVICWRCNNVKKDGDSTLHRKIADYIDRFCN